MSGESRAAEAEVAVEEVSTPRRSRNWPKSLLKLALRLVGLALLVHVFGENRDSFREVFAHRPDFRFLAMAFALCLLALVTTFLRWLIIVRAQGLALRLRDAVRVGFAGNAVDQVVPGQVGGDVLKANYLRRSGGGTARAVASILLDRAIGILGLFTLAAAMGAVNWAHAAPEVRRLIVVVWVAWLAATLGVAAALTPALPRALRPIARGRKRIEHLVEELHAVSIAYRDRRFRVGLALVMSTASHSLYALSFSAVGLALLPDPPRLVDGLLMIPLVMFSTVVPLPFGALGLSEQVSEDLFRLLGHPSGALVMLGFRIISLTVAIVSVTVYVSDSRERPAEPPT